jgi:oleandomycin transport system permease protein
MSTTPTTQTTTLPSPAAAAARPGGRPRRFALIRHSVALAQRSLIKTMRTPEALIDVTLQPVIFLALFTYVFGGAIAGAGQQHAYLQYLLPGILAQTIAMGATSIGVNLNTDISKGVFDRFRSLPIAKSAPLIGAVAADVVRYAIVALVTLGMGMIMGFRVHTDPLSAAAGCLIAVAFALCLSWVSVFIGMLVRTPGAVQGLMVLIVLPLSFGSNTFVRSSTLPGWMQGFVKVNPITQLASTVRGLFLGGPVADHLLWTCVWMAGLVVVFMPLAMRAYRRKA